MRIAILGDPIDQQNAGIHVFTLEMVKAMIKNNKGHELILIRENADSELTGIEQVAIKSTSLTAAIRKFVIIPRLLNKLKVDAVIEPAHFGPFNLNKKIKRVTIIHDLTPILFPELHQPLSAFLQKLFLPRILKQADLIITNSDNTKKDICEYFPSVCEKTKRIYPGKTEIFKKANDKSVLEKYHLNSAYFIFVGTIEPRKNLGVLLKAFKLFKEQNPSDTKLLIVGAKGWKSESFYKKVDIHPNKKDITLSGFVITKELPTLYSQAIALVYTSKYEGFGLPVLEAMNCGTPAIIPSHSSLKEAGGNAANYFESNNAADLCEQMTQVWSKKKENSIAIEKLLFHASQFDWNLFANELFRQIKS